MIAHLFPALMLAALLGGCTTVSPATREMAAPRHALAPEDHLRLATFLEEKAFAYEDEAEDQAWLARALHSDPAAVPSRRAALDQELLSHLRAAAVAARAIAAEHRRAAGAAEF